VKKWGGETGKIWGDVASAGKERRSIFYVSCARMCLIVGADNRVIPLGRIDGLG
jgi:hypothetical protein